MIILRCLVPLAAVALFATAAPAQTTLPAPQAQTPPAISPPRLGGYLQVRETYQDPLGLTATLNRARLSADGALPNSFTYRFLIEYEAGGSARAAAAVSLRDAYIRWTRGWIALQGGQFKTPFSRSYLTSITAWETVDRPAVVDTLATKRDIGVMAEAFHGVDATLSLGVFNGEGQNMPVNRDSSVLYVARALLRPLNQLELGASGASYEGDSTRAGLEANIEQSGMVLRGEWIAQYRSGQSGRDDGWYVLAAARVLPWAQLVGMGEDLERVHLGVAGRNRALTLGANLDLGANRTRLSVNWVQRESGPKQVMTRTTIAQLQVRL
jgi:hypothetical protein